MIGWLGPCERGQAAGSAAKHVRFRGPVHAESESAPILATPQHVFLPLSSTHERETLYYALSLFYSSRSPDLTGTAFPVLRSTSHRVPTCYRQRKLMTETPSFGRGRPQPARRA
jgi:hypothetical protein